MLAFLPSIVSFVLPWLVLYTHWIKNKKKFTFNIPGFDSIDEKKGGERIKAIDAFYSNVEEVSRLISNSSLFHRKSYLEWYTGESSDIREITSLIFSAVLGGLATSLFALEFLGKDLISTDGNVNVIWMSIFLFLVSVALCFLIYKFLGKPQDVENYIHMYELSYIEKALKEYMDESHEVNIERASQGEEKKYIVNVDGKTSHVTLREV